MADAEDTSNTAYIGVDPQYKNHAYDQFAPLTSSTPARVTTEVQAEEADTNLMQPNFGDDQARNYAQPIVIGNTPFKQFP